MRRFKAVIGVAVVALFACAALAAGSASAVTLPAFSVSTGAHGTSGTGTLTTVGGSTVTCTSDTSAQGPTSVSAGTFKVLFKGCTSTLSTKCTGLTNTAGSQEITLEGGYELARVRPTGSKVVASLLALKELHFTCENASKSIVELLLVKGNILTPITPVGVKTTSFVLNSVGTKGKPTYTEYENNGGTASKAQLLSRFGETGTFEESNDVTEDKLLSEAATEIKEN
jgi:hypothetical protein